MKKKHQLPSDLQSEVFQKHIAVSSLEIFPHYMTTRRHGRRLSAEPTRLLKTTARPQLAQKANTTQNQMHCGVNKTSHGGDEDVGKKTKQTNHSIYFTPNASSLFRLVAAGPDNIDEAPNPRILTPSYKPRQILPPDNLIKK